MKYACPNDGAIVYEGDPPPETISHKAKTIAFGSSHPSGGISFTGAQLSDEPKECPKCHKNFFRKECSEIAP